jgi:hypothetical protein
MLSVIMLIVVMLNVIMLSVVAHTPYIAAPLGSAAAITANIRLDYGCKTR